MFRPFIVLTVVALFISIAPGHAAVLDQIRDDFRPVSGVVIMPVEEEFLLDLDASSGVRVGDLFAVVRQGQRIVHPETKEVLGALDEVKGVLQVTRIKSGYSYARPVGQTEGTVTRGDKVRRYANLAATFWDYTDDGEEFYPELKAALPELDWPAYEAAQAQRPESQEGVLASDSRLFFLLRRDGLQVRGPGFQVLRTYPLPEAAKASPAAAVPKAADERDKVSAQVPTATAPAPAPAPSAAAGEREGRLIWDRQPAESGEVAVSFPELSNLGSLPRGTVMGDFTRDGERLLLATTDGRELKVFEVGQTLRPIAAGDTIRPGEIFAVHWWRPDGDGPLYLALTYAVELNMPVTSYIGHKAVGAIFRLQGERLVPVREGLGYILGAFDRDGDGRKETLLGQAFDRDIFFGEVKLLQLAAEDVDAQEVPFTLPRLFSVQGSLFADLSGDGALETVTVRNQTLYIYSGRELLYQAPQQVGGSLSQMEYYPNPGLKEGDLSTQAFEVPPVARDLDGDGIPELVAIASEGGLVSMPGIGPGVKKAWLAVFKYRDGMFLKGTFERSVDMPVQGLFVDADRALLVATSPSSLLGKKGRSHLLALPLK